MKRQTAGSSDGEELQVTGGGGGGGTVNQGTAGVDPWLVKGTKSHNAAAPTSDNLGVLPAVANAAAPIYTEGRQVLLSTDLGGALRVTGPLTDAQLRATPVPVSGTVTVTATNLDIRDLTFAADKVDVSGSTGVGVTGPLTDAQLRASAVPISAASLPLPTGAATLVEQQTQTTALQIIDDWDELDRAKVNPIVGQAGVAAGAGVVGVTVQRTTLASDDPAVVALQVIDDWDESDRAKVNLIVGQAGVAADAGATSVSTQRVVTVTRATPVKYFIGSAQTVINSAVDIAAGNFGGAPSATYDNTSDATYPYAPYALAMLEAPDWAAAPVAGTTVDLFGILKDIDGTDDETDAPSGTSAGGAHYFGSWYIAAVDALQRRVIVINTLGYNLIDFYVRNGTAQNMNNDAGTNLVVKVSPLTTGYPF